MTAPVSYARQAGFTLVEVMVSLLIGAFVVAGLAGVVSGTLAIRAQEEARIGTVRAAEFALDRMVRAVGRTTSLVLPLAENPGTVYSESVREPGVLAVVLDPDLDRDRDGVADADNDGDGLVDEDPDKDVNDDGAHGIAGIDDDNDGSIDEGGPDGTGNYTDDDEDGALGEDPWNGADDDGDGAVGEDPGGDVNGDSAAGIAGVDDDGDGTVDENPIVNDDEDAGVNEDWVDTVAWFLAGTDLLERMPDLGASSGTDYTERVIAQNVTRFRVERVAASAGARAGLVDLTLDILASDGETVSLTTRVRVGGGR